MCQTKVSWHSPWEGPASMNLAKVLGPIDWHGQPPEVCLHPCHYGGANNKSNYRVVWWDVLCKLHNFHQFVNAECWLFFFSKLTAFFCTIASIWEFPTFNIQHKAPFLPCLLKHHVEPGYTAAFGCFVLHSSTYSFHLWRAESRSLILSHSNTLWQEQSHWGRGECLRCHACPTSCTNRGANVVL